MTIRINTRTKRINSSRSVLASYGKQAKNIIASGGQLVMNEAKQSIQQHSSSGRTYGNHTASSAGNPPNSDTGYLANNIYLVIETDGFAADVESRADYSEHLEFGTSKMQARPFLQPALEANRKKIVSMFKRLKAKGA